MTPDIETTKRMIAEVMRLRMEDHISHHELGRSLDANTVITSRCDELAKKWVLGVEAKLLGKTHEVQLNAYSVPATGWDIWKEAFFPAWALRRWPVRYRHVTAPCWVSLCCPHHSTTIRDDARHLEFMAVPPTAATLEALCSRDSSSASGSGSAGDSCRSPSPGASPSTSPPASTSMGWRTITRRLADFSTTWFGRGGSKS